MKEHEFFFKNFYFLGKSLFVCAIEKAIRVTHLQKNTCAKLQHFKREVHASQLTQENYDKSLSLDDTK